MRKMEWRKAKTLTRAALAGALGLAMATLAIGAHGTARALEASPAPKSAATAAEPPPPESMSVVPEEEPSTAPPPAAGAPAPAAPSKRPTRHTRKSAPPEVEPATARLRISRDTWIFAGPSKWTKHITRAHSSKFVNVSGSTRYYLQVQLKDGQTGYISPSDVDLVRPSDKVFVLTQDAAVIEAPNHWGKKLAEVHRGHNVHVTGVALNYMQIRMKNGVVGFIPASALQ
jgi:hypothetical protein